MVRGSTYLNYPGTYILVIEIHQIHSAGELLSLRALAQDEPVLLALRAVKGSHWRSWQG